MKISEMTNDQATQAIISITGPISNICDDEEALKLLDEVKGKTVAEALAKNLTQIVAFLLDKHKADLYQIVGALCAVPVGKVGKMNFMETVKEIQNSIDDVVIGFFKRSAIAERNKDGE